MTDLSETDLLTRVRRLEKRLLPGGDRTPTEFTIEDTEPPTISNFSVS